MSQEKQIKEKTRKRKPSDRIIEIYNKYREQEDPAHATLFAICDYLDKKSA